MPKKRLTVRNRKLALKAKKGLDKMPKFRKGDERGEVIYENLEAVSVENHIGKRGRRRPFDLHNVEWLSRKGEMQDTRGDNIGGWGGVIYWGKIKFRGKARAEKLNSCWMW